MNKKYKFIRVAAAVPKLSVANTVYNSKQIVELINAAEKNGTDIVVFPECCITGYTANDLFHQKILQVEAINALISICKKTSELKVVSIVGLPIAIDNQLFNCAAILQSGKILGIVPKTFIPGYKEYYEQRWFASGNRLISDFINIGSEAIPIGTDLLFQASGFSDIIFGVEICEDLWVATPPSSSQSISGATLLFNLSASNELISKKNYRESLVKQQSGNCVAAYVLSSAGVYESTTDMVFSGHAIIAENGIILEKNKRFQRKNNIIFSDIDVERLALDRQFLTSFGEAIAQCEKKYRIVSFSIHTDNWTESIKRKISAYPFVPENKLERSDRCEEIFSIQTAGLAKRLEHCNCENIVIGLSGGLDSTLALLVCIKTYELLGLNKKNIRAITMPGFGTSNQTYENVKKLSEALEIPLKKIDIREACEKQFKDIEHDNKLHDIVYENVQARQRTLTLMNIANKISGLVIGTGDLSEIALGWSTYSGDHISMYNVNCGVPKTLVKYLIQWVADTQTSEKVRVVLEDILSTPISPELLPTDSSGKITQKTEDKIGPYELHDFFLYYFVRFNISPDKIFYLSKIAFKDKYSDEIIKKWLDIFIKRFFAAQFKRSCVPDGPKVGSVSLSPRGDWRMPSDASSKIWLNNLENI